MPRKQPYFTAEELAKMPEAWRAYRASHFANENLRVWGYLIDALRVDLEEYKRQGNVDGALSCIDAIHKASKRRL